MAWWEGLRAHRLLLQHCRDCGRTRFPPMPSCPWCASTAFDVVESTGDGVVYSYVTAHVAVSPGYAGSLPYSVATVELAEGPRLLGRVEPAAPLAIGDRVGTLLARAERSGCTPLAVAEEMASDRLGHALSLPT